ncbi:MAG TPA: hypothetical protein VGN75_12500 [Kaistia sp.]|jgi:hypothetical protein|nr:hypothetical protein [Kaistia sp.]
MTKRERWITHLTTSRHVHRFLTRIGGASDPAVAPAISEDELRDYLASLKGGADDAKIMLEVMELLTRGYDDFVVSMLPKLLTVLANRAEHQREIVGPGLRGVVRWDLTKIGRVNRTLPSTRYISNVQQRSYGTPENLLLRWLLEDIERGVARIGRRIGTSRLHPVLKEVRNACQGALRNEALSSVEAIRSLAPHMIHASRQSRHPGYRQAAELARRRQRMQEKGRASQWTLALELLRTKWLEPISDDDLFELFALSTVISVLAEEVGLGKPCRYGLLGSTLEPAAIFKTVEVTVQVFFDRAPNKLLGSTSRYKNIISAYEGIDGSERRPDILVHAEYVAGGSRTFLVEVKNASSTSYIRNSIYKLFGYLYDYDGLFKKDENRRGALYLPEGAVHFGGTEEEGSGIVILCENERERFADALRHGLKLESPPGDVGKDGHL